jgi:hypothetical protein
MAQQPFRSALTTISVSQYHAVCSAAWTGEQPVARLLPTQDITDRLNVHIHWSSGIRTQDYSIWASDDNDALDRPAIATSNIVNMTYFAVPSIATVFPVVFIHRSVV